MSKLVLATSNIHVRKMQTLFYIYRDNFISINLKSFYGKN